MVLSRRNSTQVAPTAAPVVPVTPTQIPVESLIWTPSGTRAVVPQQQQTNDASIKFVVVVSASGGKGGTLRGSHPEIDSGLLYCSIVKVISGSAYTTDDDTDERAYWNKSELKKQSVALQMSLDDLEAFGDLFDDRPTRGQGGRAIQVTITAAPDWTMNENGVFFCPVIDIDGDSITAPTGISPSIEEQKILAAVRAEEFDAYRNRRVESGRAARQQQAAAPAPTPQSSDQATTVEDSDVFDASTLTR